MLHTESVIYGKKSKKNKVKKAYKQRRHSAIIIHTHTYADKASTTIIAFLPSNGFIASAMWKERVSAIWCIQDTQYAHTKKKVPSILPHPNQQAAIKRWIAPIYRK